MKREEPVCNRCKGTDINRDGAGAWNTTTQSWELVTVYDRDCWCNNCEEENNIYWREVHENHEPQ